MIEIQIEFLHFENQVFGIIISLINFRIDSVDLFEIENVIVMEFIFPVNMSNNGNSGCSCGIDWMVVDVFGCELNVCHLILLSFLSV